MDATRFVSERVLTGWLLVISGLIFAAGATLYAARVIWKRVSVSTPGYLRWERGLVIAAALVVLLGWAFLERMLEAAGDTILAPAGLVLFFTGAVLILVVETYNLSKQEWLYATVVLSVVLTFLAQAVFGAALIDVGAHGRALLPGWIGWATILWNLAWLVILPIARPKEIYYPWIHYTASLLVGIALLVKG